MLLTSAVILTVPSTNFNEAVSASEFNARVSEVASEFCKLYGGATAKPGATGYYISQSGELIQESVTTVTALCNDWELEKLQPLLDSWKHAWKQEALLIEFQSGLHSIIE
jgi:hypothetical protein